MKTLVLGVLLLLQLAAATCNLRSGECAAKPALLQQFSLNPFTWQTQLQNAFFGSVNQALGSLFTQMYGEEESDLLISQIQNCERIRSTSMVAASLRTSMLTYQFATLCSNTDPVTSSTNLFTQVLNILVPLISPCPLDEDIAGDFVVAQMLAYISTSTNNSTRFQNGTAALLNMTQRLFDISETMLGNFSNSLSSLADRGMLDDAVVPQLIDLLQGTLSGVEDVYGQAMTQAQTDLAGAIQDAEEGLQDIQINLVDSLTDLDVPQDDINDLTATMQNITSSVMDTLSLIQGGDEDRDDAQESLGEFTQSQTDLVAESLQILVEILAQSMDEFCASTRASA